MFFRTRSWSFHLWDETGEGRVETKKMYLRPGVGNLALQSDYWDGMYHTHPSILPFNTKHYRVKLLALQSDYYTGTCWISIVDVPTIPQPAYPTDTKHYGVKLLCSCRILTFLLSMSLQDLSVGISSTFPSTIHIWDVFCFWLCVLTLSLFLPSCCILRSSFLLLIS